MGAGSKSVPPRKNLVPLGSGSKRSLSTNTNATPHLEVGYNVEHSKFGKGKVTALSGTGGDQKAEVFFPRVGKKTLILKFARLKVLD